jgi:hypothetical protein
MGARQRSKVIDNQKRRTAMTKRAGSENVKTESGDQPELSIDFLKAQITALNIENRKLIDEGANQEMSRLGIIADPFHRAILIESIKFAIAILKDIPNSEDVPQYLEPICDARAEQYKGTLKLLLQEDKELATE